MRRKLTQASFLIRASPDSVDFVHTATTQSRVSATLPIDVPGFDRRVAGAAWGHLGCVRIPGLAPLCCEPKPLGPDPADLVALASLATGTFAIESEIMRSPLTPTIARAYAGGVRGSLAQLVRALP